MPKVQAHIVVFERMFRYRAGALVDQVETPAVLVHYAKEKRALAAGMAALRYHRAAIQGLPLPLGALRDVVEAADSGQPGALVEAIERARAVANCYPSNDDLLGEAEG